MPRLVTALEALAAGAPQYAPFEMQHGATDLPAGWTGRPAYRPDEMDARMRRATIVISHGGPATIASARAAGKVPIVVPRLERFGEHVDDHQLWYAERLSALGEILLADTAHEIARLVRRYRILVRELPPAVAHDPGPAVARFTEIAEALIHQ